MEDRNLGDRVFVLREEPLQNHFRSPYEFSFVHPHEPTGTKRARRVNVVRRPA